MDLARQLATTQGALQDLQDALRAAAELETEGHDSMSTTGPTDVPIDFTTAHTIAQCFAREFQESLDGTDPIARSWSQSGPSCTSENAGLCNDQSHTSREPALPMKPWTHGRLLAFLSMRPAMVISEWLSSKMFQTLEDIVLSRVGAHISCEACTTRVTASKALTLACPEPHSYCEDCVKQMFHLALFDESQYPPKCCVGTIEVDAACRFLSEDFVQTYKEREIEYNSPERCYCSNAACAAFVPPSRVEDGVATCPQCDTDTCTTCFASAHTGTCPSNEDDQALLRLAGEQGWVQCYRCKAMVELVNGCNHMVYV